MKTLLNITLYAISKGILGALEPLEPLEPLIISDSVKYLGAQRPSSVSK